MRGRRVGRGLLSAAGAALLLAGPVQAAPSFRPPHNGFGQPDLSGNWSNATLTPQARPARFGGRLAMTTAEVA